MAKIAIVHDWLNGMRGGEIVLEEVLNVFPTADIYTLFYNPEKISQTINLFPIYPSFFNKLPVFLKRRYRYFLPFFPLFVKTINLKEYDYIFSVSHCFAKAVSKQPGQKHICYCNSPMRYLYDQFDVYFRKQDGSLKLSGLILKLLRTYLQKWDFLTSRKEYVDYFIANSGNIASKIKKYWQRDSEVIYPFVNDDFYTPEENVSDDDFFLVVSALVPYKRIDISIDAFNKTGKKLIVIGEGTEYKKLTAMAKPNISFTGRVDDNRLRDHYRRCKALIFPGEEDFGIVPLEAMACGKPVIAYGKGGVTETVVDGKTGLFFDKPEADSLIEALNKFNSADYKPEDCRTRAEEFSRKVFKERLENLIRKEFHSSI